LNYTKIIKKQRRDSSLTLRMTARAMSFFIAKNAPQNDPFLLSPCPVFAKSLSLPLCHPELYLRRVSLSLSVTLSKTKGLSFERRDSSSQNALLRMTPSFCHPEHIRLAQCKLREGSLFKGEIATLRSQ
jgi:hypothetical protein